MRESDMVARAPSLSNTDDVSRNGAEGSAVNRAFGFDGSFFEAGVVVVPAPVAFEMTGVGGSGVVVVDGATGAGVSA